MQIPLVESRLALSYSSWFSDLGFAFFVRRLRSAHFLILEVWTMKKTLIAVIVLLTLLCLVACNNTSSIACPKCGYENTSGVKFCSDCGASMTSSNDSNQNSDSNNNDENDNNNNITSCQHSFGDWIEKKAASCTNVGTKERTCSKCSQKETETISALGHTATTGVCNRCNERMGWSKEEVQKIVQVHDVWVYDINSADGVEMSISWTNTSDKTIKYIHFYVEPYNAVNDKMSCDIRDHSLFDAYVTGPCESGYKGYRYLHFYEDGVPQYKGTLWENCWYNSSIRTIDLVGIKIIYMDDTEIELDRDSAQLAFTPYEVDQKVAHAYSSVWHYEDEDPYYLLNLSLTNNDGINLKKDVFVDVQIVNNDDVTIYSKTFEIKESDFYEENHSWETSIIIFEWELDSGDTEYGQVYCKVYNSSYGINIEDSTSIEELPITDYTLLSTLYSDVVPITLSDANDGDIVINEITYVFETGWELGNVHLTVYVSTQRIDHLTESFELSGILSQMDGTYTSEFSSLSWAYEYNETDEVQLMFYNIPAGEYYIDFNDKLTDKSGLVYNLTEERNGYSVSMGECTATNVVIPSVFKGLPVVSIGDYAFSYCDSLNSVSIPNSVTYIGEEAFYGCSSLTSISIPNSIVNIGDSAFGECTELTTVDISDSVINIGDYAFYGCTSLVNIVVSENNQNYKSVDGNLLSKDGKTFIQYTIGKTSKTFVVPNNVIRICASAFEGCHTLTNIELPNTLENIDTFAFGYCTSLESIEIPDSVNSIGYAAFSDCTALKTIVLPKEIASINAWLFSGCTSLTTIAIPENVTNIGSNAFLGCQSLESVTISAKVKLIEYCVFIDCESLTTIHFKGSKSQWEAIEKDTEWDLNTGNYTIYCTDGELTK